MKTLLFGIAWIVGAFWFCFSIAGNPVDELALIRRAQVAPGLIVATWEEPSDGDDGGTHWFHEVTYTYRLPDGREFTQRTKSGSGRLKEGFRHLQRPCSVVVEYLPDNPKVSRIKGDGCSTITEWLWRKVGLGLAVLALFATPGVLLVRDGVRELRHGGSLDDGDNRDERL
jgi:hypothetical protein